MLAFDRNSVRSFDSDGHLHVATANLSRAAINPYRGSEIPDWERHGLKPDKIYKLFRHPEELKKAASTFAGKPILLDHKPLAADDHPYQKTVGAVGSNVSYEHPFLKAPLTIWPGDAINRIKSGDNQQISCAYKYRFDPTPGTYEGEDYDGIMRDIVANHVALVESGRAGPECIVGDSMENVKMALKPLTRKAAMAQGAVIAFLAPKLAQDAKINLKPVFAKVTAANYDASKPAIVEAVQRVTNGKLAQDADLADLAALLDAFSGSDPAEEVGDEDPMMTDPNGGAPAMGGEDELDPAAPPAAEGGDPIEKIKTFLKGKLAPEDMAQLDAMVAALGGGAEAPAKPDGSEEDAYPAADEEGEDPGNKDEPLVRKEISNLGKDDMTGKEKIPMVTKPAMDAAIADAEKRSANAVMKTQREIREAEKAVRPYVGEIAIACDSAETVYRTALKMRGIASAGTLSGDLLGVLKALPTASEMTRQPKRIAQDAAASDDFFKRFPGAARIGAA